MNDTEILVNKYFRYSFHNTEILNFLKQLHNINISYRTLQRILSTLKLYRRKNFSSIESVVKFIERELEKSSRLHGYKWMHLKCIQNNLIVTQETVREILKCVDPEGVEIRSRRRLHRRQYYSQGPNYLWHVDSYDKLKPYGICISGCIDGFSRHIIWIKASSTTSDPKVIGGYFVEAIKKIGGVPKSLRCDLGTENVSIEKIQTCLHSVFNENPSSKPCFLYGKSTHNQRIEAWWGILRKHNAQFWMNLFQMLRDNDEFDGSFLDKSLIQFCFLDLIQEDLYEVVLQWNIHKIRKTRNSIAPSGRPAIMFEMPSLYNANNCIVTVPNFGLEALQSQYSVLKFPCDEDVFHLSNFLMSENGYKRSIHPFETVDLYINLRRIIKLELNSM